MRKGLTKFSCIFEFGAVQKTKKGVNGNVEIERRDILQFLIILAEQSAICTIWAPASRHRHWFFDPVQPLLALSAQRALCTFFSLLLQATLLRCGLMVSSPGPCASSGGRLPEAFFLVFRLESQGAKVLRGRVLRPEDACQKRFS